MSQVRQKTRHVVFIGETGSGKSSVINLIAGRECATVSPDAMPCTGDFASYEVSMEERTYRLWDTPGLNKPASGFLNLKSMFGRRATSTTGSLKRFLQERHRHGELDLLVFCVQGGRASEGMSKAYRMFCHATRQIGIPVVIAITRLEKTQPTMDVWWDENEGSLGNLGLIFDGQACITCLLHHHRRWASQQEIRFLISKESQRASSRPGLSDQEYLDDDKGCVVC